MTTFNTDTLITATLTFLALVTSVASAITAFALPVAFGLTALTAFGSISLLAVAALLFVSADYIHNAYNEFRLEALSAKV